MPRASQEQSNSSCRRSKSLWTLSNSSAIFEAIEFYTCPFSFSNGFFWFRTPPPNSPGLMSFSGSCRGACRSLQHSSCRLQPAMDFPWPRSCCFLLRCQRRCRIPCSGRRRGAHGIVRDGTTVIFVAVLDDLNLCLSGNLGCSFIVLGRAAWLAVLPLTGPVITVLHPE